MAGPLENLTVGTVSYGGVTFTAYTNSKVSAVPQYDEAKRTVIWVDYALDIEGYLDNSGSSTDSVLDTWRQTLLTPAQALVYTQKGFGTFSINAPGGQQKDAAWGPTPELLDFQPYGNLGCKVHWRVSGRMPSCPGAKYAKAIAAVNFEVSWDINSQTGLTTRTISGYLLIPQTRLNGGRTLQDSADAYWEQVYPPAIDGFRRSHSRNIDKSKNRLTFTIRDEELYAPLPDGVMEGHASHSIGSGIEKGFNNWTGTISASFNMSRDGVTKADAWKRFQLIFESRIGGKAAQAAQMVALGAIAGGAGGKGDAGSVVMVTGLEVSEENIFGPATNFTLRYMLMGVPLDQILTASGMWKPVPGTSFASWKTSMKNVFGPRGTAKMGLKNSDDAIVDLCGTRKPSVMKAGANVAGQAVLKAGKLPVAKVAAAAAKRAWIRFNNKLKVYVDERIVQHVPLGNVAVIGGQKGPDARQLDPFTGEFTPDTGITATTLMVLQKVSASIIDIVMDGEGIRAGARVPIPVLRTVAGQPVKQLQREVKEEQIGGVKGMPIYKTTWHIWYTMRLPAAGVLPVLANPAFGQEGGDAGENLGN